MESEFAFLMFYPFPSPEVSLRVSSAPCAARFHREFKEINLKDIQMAIDCGRLDPSQPITIKTLVDEGLVRVQDQVLGVKLLAKVRS